jgi:hypothetical protein
MEVNEGKLKLLMLQIAGQIGCPIDDNGIGVIICDNSLACCECWLKYLKERI